MLPDRVVPSASLVGPREQVRETRPDRGHPFEVSRVRHPVGADFTQFRVQLGPESAISSGLVSRELRPEMLC